MVGLRWKVVSASAIASTSGIRSASSERPEQRRARPHWCNRIPCRCGGNHRSSAYRQPRRYCPVRNRKALGGPCDDIIRMVAANEVENCMHTHSMTYANEVTKNCARISSTVPSEERKSILGIDRS